MNKLTAKQIYTKLIDEDKILEVAGQIRFYLGDVDIVVRQKDVVGNIIQEWLEGWLKKRGIAYAVNPNTQMPPDFFLDPKDKTKNLLEVKAFNRKASPGFDIADFRMYEEEIVSKPYMLDVDYLIFGYQMSEDGVVTVKDIWLKKVWEITRPMDGWALNLQKKKKVVHKIRPGVWYSRKPQRFLPFASLPDFVAAVEETVYQNVDTHDHAADWRNRFIDGYKAFYGREIVLPRWHEVKPKYVLPKKKGRKAST